MECITNLEQFNTLIHTIQSDSKIIENKIIIGLNLENINSLNKITFNNCIFKEFNFIDSKMEDNIFKNCKFEIVRFTNSKILNTHFTKCYFSYVNINNCNLHGHNFINTILKVISFNNCNLNNGMFDMVTTSVNFKLINCTVKNMCLKNSNLTIDRLVNTDLSQLTTIQETLIRLILINQKEPDVKIIQISNVGYYRRTITYLLKDDIIFNGCFKGTFDDFESRVKNKYFDCDKTTENGYLTEYDKLTYQFIDSQVT